MTNSEMRTGKNRNTGLCNPPADPEVDHEKTSRQKIKTRVSTRIKLPGTDRVTPPLLTPLADNGASIEEALTNIVGSIGEQNEQMSLRMSELERAVHVERENQREEINRSRQEVNRSEKRLKERTDEHLEEQSLGTFDTKIDVMMERRTEAIMDRLDGLLGSRSGSKNGEPNSGEPSREPRVNFNEQPNRERQFIQLCHRGQQSTGPKHQRKFNWQQTDLKRTTNARYTCDWEM